MDVVLFLVTPGVGTIMMAALVALAPAMLGAWRDRTLLARGREDPSLPERLLATQWWVRGSVAIATAVLIVFWTWHAVWSLPLLFVARRWVVYRLRRTLLGESWSFGLYLSYFLRTAIGLGVMTLLVVLSPLIVGAADAGVARWGVACALGALLGLWQVRHARVLLWLWRATPLENVDLNEYAGPRVDANTLIALQAACADILARATTAPTPTRVWLAGPRGAVIANAVALPGVDQAHIVISRTLLERLTIDEIAAIVAHEAAHLEHFHRVRMTRQRLIAWTQIAAGVLLIPVLHATAPGLIETGMIVWPAIVVVGLMVRAARVHRNEVASDRRALELCGNPEALMSALTTLYTISRQPRRWSARATKHPSLAQRLRAIRQLAGFRAPAIEQIEIFDAPGGDAVMLLDRTTLQQASGVPPGTPRDADTLLARARAVRRVDYTSVKAMRIVAPWRRPAALQVTERGGRRFEAPLRDEDLPRLHDLLDIIEFGMPIERPAAVLSERDIAVGLLIVSLAIGQIWSLALLAALALIRPAAEILIGAGLALSLVGVLQWIDPSTAATNLLPAWVIVALGGVAVDLVLWRLWSGRASQAKAPAWCVASVVAAAAIVWLHGLLQWDGSLLRFAQVARVTPAAMLLPLAAAVVVARVRIRGRRVFAVALAMAAIVPAVITTRWFQDEVVRDPLLAAASPLPVITGDADVIGTSASDRDSNELRLSPEGHVLAEAERDADSDRVGDFTIRTSDGKTRDLHADDLQFLDDTRALLLVTDTDGLALRLENLGEKNKTEWSLTLPGLRWSRLSLSPATRHWRVIGNDGRGQVVRLQGTVGEAEYDDVRWKADERGVALVGSGNAMLVSRTDWRASLMGRLLPELAMATSRRSSFDVSLWRVRAGAPTLLARSSADVDCVEAPVDLEPAVCFAFDGIATRVWMLNPDDKRVTPIGVLTGYARPLTRGSDGTLVAWWKEHPVLLQLDPLRVRELSTIAVSRWAHAALASNHLLIADGSSSTPLAIYRVQTELTRSSPPVQP